MADENMFYKPPKMKATQKEMQDAKIPVAWRDFCAHLLIPLNKCRNENFYMPWACKHERHEYEKCQYKDYKKRVIAMERYREATKNKN